MATPSDAYPSGRIRGAVRRLAVADAEFVWELRRRALAEHPEAFGRTVEELHSLDELRARLQAAGEPLADSAIFGAFVGGTGNDAAGDPTLVGSAGLLRNARTKMRHRGFLWGMYVAPEARGRGLGRALVDAVIAQGRALGLEQIHLTVSQENEAAAALYRACGFRSYGVEPHAMKLGERYLDAILMVRMLEPPP